VIAQGANRLFTNPGRKAVGCHEDFLLMAAIAWGCSDFGTASRVSPNGENTGRF